MIPLRTQLVLSFLGVSSLCAATAEEVSDGEKLFALKVQPLFAEKCLACHGQDPEKLKGGFDMRTREALLRGGETFGEEVVLPGEGTASVLYRVAARIEEDYEMPPKEADRLSEEEAWALRDWIDAGAPWPDDDSVAQIQQRYAEGVQVETSGGLSEDWDRRRYQAEDLWAYQPLRLGAHRDVDGYLDAALAAAELEPAPQAEGATLLRRATYNLTGLPPTPEELHTYLTEAEQRPDAWSRWMDRLLASPRYGEQAARHWLDVVRYADSAGFANDYERPNTWRYRDYVVRSFNADTPYDAFVRAQIAGDELGQRKDVEGLIATGFLRMGAWEHTGMSVAKVTRQQFLDDVTDSVSQVFLAHALRCAKCHDHKFDPVPTRDYYRFQAIFATTQFAEVTTEWLPQENLNGMDEDRHYHTLRQQAIDQRLEALDAKHRAYEKAWFTERGLPYQTRQQAKKAGFTEAPSGRLFKTPEEFGSERIARKWNLRFHWEMERYRPVAFTVYNGKTRSPGAKNGPSRMPQDPMSAGELQQTTILTGGDVFAPGEPVTPGVLSATPGGREVPIPDGVGGRRKALAQWITDPGNPLTARVMVNRLWQWHFGKALAQNPNNFGATGKKPTHPALLDWLASEFIRRDWSVKQLHRLMLQSQAYRRSSTHPDPEALEAKDSARNLYATFLPRRLSAEELRDAMLAVSGELNTEMGGIPIRPDMNLEAALQPRMIMGTFAPSYVPHPRPEQRNRRTLYAHKTRGQRDPFLETFNQPSPELSCERRDESNITPQVFALFNSEESQDRALAFAARLLRETEDAPAAIQRAFQLTVGRPPSPRELEVTLQHWEEMAQRQQNLTFSPSTPPTEVVREAQEENTGEPFTFTETLFVYQDYVPDLQLHQVDASTRALADVCLALLNANEFIYLH